MAEPKRPSSLLFNEALLKRFIEGTLEPEVDQKVANFLESRPDLLKKISAKSGDDFLKRLREVQQQRLSEKSCVQVKAEVVERERLKNASTKGDAAIPTALANYAGYEIIKELGRGGMGVVYLAKNIQMDRLEVLKVLNERLLDHEGAKERFLREIRAVSKLSHPNIVTSYSILPLDHLLVFSMEYVQGMDLHQFTHQNKPISVGLACSFAQQIAAGLEHAHERGLVHRDIKPSNIIVYKSNGRLQLKILDFGLAKATSEEAVDGAGLTQDGTMLGTPEYMSPEQTLNAAKADIRADIYSLGCTLYYMLAGKPPFTGTHGAVIVHHAQHEPTSINLVRPDVPTELVVVVGKMLAKDLRKRYQTPSEVAKALSPFVNQNRSAAKNSIDDAAVSNTVNDLSGADRETSVEGPLSELSLDANHQPVETQQNLTKLAASLKATPFAQQTRRSVVRKKVKPRSPRWFLSTVIGLGVIVFFGATWQLASLIFRTPNGTIVVEKMPADAEVLVDGRKLEITWNAGKDKAEISIEAGSHQLRVVNQGNEIFGDRVSVKGGNSTVVKLSMIETLNESKMPKVDSREGQSGLAGFQAILRDAKPRLLFRDDFDVPRPFQKLNESYVENGALTYKSSGNVAFGCAIGKLSEDQYLIARLRVRNVKGSSVGISMRSPKHEKGAGIWIDGSGRVFVHASLFAPESVKKDTPNRQVMSDANALESWNELVCLRRNRKLYIYVNNNLIDTQQMDTGSDEVNLAFTIRSSAHDSVAEMDSFALYALD